MIRSSGFRSVVLRGRPRRRKSVYQSHFRKDTLFFGSYPYLGETYWFDSRVVRYISPEYKMRYGRSESFL